MKRRLFVCFSFSNSRSSVSYLPPLFIKAPSEKSTLQRKPADASSSAAPAKPCQLQGCCREPPVEQAQQNSASPGTAGSSCDPVLRSRVTEINAHIAHIKLSVSRVTAYGPHARTQALAQCRCECIPAVEQAGVAEVQGNCGSFVFFVVTQLQNN